MPLTFSHPAITLPAKYLPERWVSMTGLIIGSITPDFEYFIRLKEESVYSHTLAGMFWFDLPLALVLTFVYHYIVRNTFICNSPAFLRKRLSPYRGFNWINYFNKHFIVVFICLLVGIASHIFWDDFTHPSGHFVKMIPLLRENLYILKFLIPNNRLLQAISTTIGGMVIFYAIMRMPEDVDICKQRNATDYWLILAGMGVVAVNVRMLENIYDFDYQTIALSTLSGFIAGSIVAPLLLAKKQAP